MTIPTIYIAQAAVLGLVVVVATWKHIQKLCNKILSVVLNAYLQRKHNWVNVEDGSKFPSAVYTWPNGQGMPLFPSPDQDEGSNISNCML